MTIEGILEKALEERSGKSEKTGQNWKMQDFILLVPGKGFEHDRRMVFTVSDGSMSRLALFNGYVGKPVKLFFDIDAREYQGKWFNQIRAYGITAPDVEEKE
jgi:hypothetical protein